MIVKFLSSASNDFHGVRYNEKKIDSGAGELMKMKNFPSSINEESSQTEVRDYLKAISKSNKTKKPQFHATISTKFREHSKEELTKVAENFMEEMGYGVQPYIVVFHNDTDNNHIHIVSTRVDKNSGKKIDDSFEKLKSQQALQKSIEKIYGKSMDKDLEKLLKYKFGSLNQLKLLLERNGFKLVTNAEDENALDILKNGVWQKRIYGNQISFENKFDLARKRQIKAILMKYRERYSNKVFKVIDNRENQNNEENRKIRNASLKVEFESELQHKMREMFGLDIIFHHKEGKTPFGFTLIDYKTGVVFKGSEFGKAKEIFDFTEEELDKRLFEKLKDYQVPNAESKQVLLEYFQRKGDDSVKDFMIFENKKKKDIEVFKQIKADVLEFIRSKNSADVVIMKAQDGKYYAHHTRFHYFHDLKALVGEKVYDEFLKFNANSNIQNEGAKMGKENLSRIIDAFLFELSKSYGSGRDPAENELKKRRKKKR